MSTPDPSEYMDDSINDHDYQSNASFEHEATDMSSSSEREDTSEEMSAHKEYSGYSHMVDVATKSNGQMLSIHHNIVEGVPVFAFSEGHVWIGDTKHGIQIREVRNFECVKKLGGSIAMRCMTLVDNEVWVGYCNGDISVYDIKNLDKAPKEISSSSSKNSIDCITQHAGIIWTGSADWELKARRQSNGSAIKSLPDGHRDWIRSILIVGSNLWSSGDDSLICLWDAETGEKVRTIELKTKHNIKVKCAILCIVGSTVWGGCADGFIRMWNYNGDYIRRFKAHKGAVTSLVCAGAHVWSGGLDKVVRIWERESTTLIEQMPVNFPVLTMAMHGTQVYLGGRAVVQVRMTSGLLEWLRNHYTKLDQDYTKVLQVYESLLVKYEAAEPEKMHVIIDQLQREKEAKEMELDDVLKQYNQLQGEMDGLLEDRNAAVERLKELEEAHVQKDKELAVGKGQLEGHKAELDGHKVELEGHKTKLAQSEAKIADHAAKISEYENKLKQQGEEKQELTEQQVQLQEKIDELQATIAELRSQQDNGEEELQNTKEELNNVKEALNNTKEELQNAKDELQQAEERGLKSTGDNDRQGTLIQELTGKLTKLEKEKQELQSQERKLGDIISVTEDKLKDEKDKHTVLEREIARLTNDLKVRDKSIHDLNTKHGKELIEARSAVQPASTTAYTSKPPTAEKCAIFVIFVLCSCLIVAVLFFLLLHMASTPQAGYDPLWPH